MCREIMIEDKTIDLMALAKDSGCSCWLDTPSETKFDKKVTKETFETFGRAIYQAWEEKSKDAQCMEWIEIKVSIEK